MNAGSIFESVSYAVISALECDLNPNRVPAYKGFREHSNEPDREVRPHEHQCNIYVFSQSWGSTALGFNGLGGAAITDAYTTVVIGPNGDACVYFAKRLAYHIQKPSVEFYQDLDKRQMAHTNSSSVYELDK